MALNNASIPVGATYAPTGGTARTIKLLQNLTTGLKLWLDDSPASTLLRKTIFANHTEARVNSGSSTGYTQERNRIEYQIPYTLTSGAVVVNKASVQIEFHPETDAAGRALLVGLGANTCVDTDFTDFLTAGSLV